jgi:hypothetical protein
VNDELHITPPEVFHRLDTLVADLIKAEGQTLGAEELSPEEDIHTYYSVLLEELINIMEIYGALGEAKKYIEAHGVHTPEAEYTHGASQQWWRSQ